MSKSKTKSVVNTAKKVTAQDNALRNRISKASAARTKDTASAKRTLDSFVDFAASLGLGADTLFSAAGYGFNPISRLRTILEWVHRGSWLGGVAIDIVADDMTKMGVDIRGQMKPEQIEHIERRAIELGIWQSINDTVKWSRLYGGCIAVPIIQGQKMETSLRLGTIGKNQFTGLLVLDRWMVEPSLNDLVGMDENVPACDIGMPRFYSVTADAPAMPRIKIHYSRCLRLDGVRLPYWQRLTENLWGISVIERLWDRMLAFDSATTGMAQLIFKSYLRTYKIKGLRDVVAAGGELLAGLTRQVEFMRRTQSIEGITLLDGEDEFEASQHSAFSGLAECMLQMGEQISGSLQIPLVRLFGQSPAGLNSTGESDMRTYFDGIRMQQESKLRIPVTRFYKILAMSEGIKPPDDFAIEFRPLWIMNDAEKISTANQLTATITSAFDSGIIDRPTALKEFSQGSKLTGVWTNISAEQIKEAEDEPLPGSLEDTAQRMELQQEMMPEETEPEGGKSNGKAKSSASRKVRSDDSRRRKTKDDGTMLGDRRVNSFDLVIEHEYGDERYGRRLPASYGYIRNTDSAERGDQMDCFVGAEPESTRIYVIDSYYPAPKGTFDEHKIMLGYSSPETALADFWSYYFDRTGVITETSHAQFRDWLNSSNLDSPYAQPFDSQYQAVALTTDKCCLRCKYLEGNVFCMNPDVQRDPKVPQSMGGAKIVNPTGWCREFKKKEKSNVQEASPVVPASA